MQGCNELSLDNEDDISVYDRVLQNPLLLFRIAGFLPCPPVPKEKNLLALRLLSRGFNEAVMEAVSSCGEIPVRLTVSKEMDESSFSRLDERLCRDVKMKTCLYGHCRGDCPSPPPPLASLFSTLVAEYGSRIQILKIDHQVGFELGTMLTRINEGCPKLFQLTIKATGNSETTDSLTDWDGHCAVSMTALVHLEVSSSPEEEFVETHVCRVVNRLLQVTPNLQKLSIEGEFSLVVDTQKIQGLKYLKHTYFDNYAMEVESSRSLVQMLNSVSATLETLEIVNYYRRSTYRSTKIEIEAAGLPTLASFPSLKSVTLTGMRVTALGLKLWDHILNGRAGCLSLETVVVELINFTDDQHHFWVPLRTLPEPLTMVTKLSLLGDLGDSFSQSERLREISAAFPNLSEFAYSTGSNEYGDGEDIQEVVGEVFQGLMDGWEEKPIKNVEIYINRRGCSIHVLLEALEAIGEDFFTNGLETLSIRAWRLLDREDLQGFIGDQQFDRLARMLLWTRNMESVTFHKIPRAAGGRLRDFISSNGLPVSFEDEE